MMYAKLVSYIIYAHYTNYGGYRDISKIKYIVIHYTANDGDTDYANAKYFQNPNLKASAHFFCDDDSITQTVPITNIAYHCGGNKYKYSDGGKYYKIVTNTNSIGIEICDTQRNGTYDMSVATERNVISLVKALMQDFNIPIENVVRHYDVTGKHCPSYFVDDAKWEQFKNKIQKHVVSTFLVKVKVDLNIRKKPTMYSEKVGCITDNGVYTIVDVKYSGNVPWGKLKSGLGWICLHPDYVRRL